MNERIKRLAVRAKLRAPIMLQRCGRIDALTDSEQEELENVEKFAELIVKECLEQVCDEVQYGSDWKLADAVTKRVMEHFGD